MLHHGVQVLPRTCDRCNQPIHYSVYYRTETVMGFDSTFCKTCDRWLEAGCETPDCTLCAPRPPRPGLVALPTRIIQ